jgi:F0F1-type ATP synthase assembly protein I
VAERRDDTMAQVAKYLSLAFTLPAGAIAGYVIGYLLDKAFGTTFLRVMFLLLGIAGGLVEVVRSLLKDTKES